MIAQLPCFGESVLQWVDRNHSIDSSLPVVLWESFPAEQRMGFPWDWKAAEDKSVPTVWCRMCPWGFQTHWSTGGRIPHGIPLPRILH